MANNSLPSTGRSSTARRFKIAKWFLEPTSAHQHPHTTVRLWGQPIPPRPDGLLLRSSSITNRLSRTLLQTRNGSEINLSGPISKRHASKQGMSLQVIDAFTNGFPTSWKLSLLDAFSTRRHYESSPRPESPFKEISPDQLPTPLPSSICVNSPDPETILPPPQTKTRSRKKPPSRPRIRTRQSASTTRSKRINVTQPACISIPTIQPDISPVAERVDPPSKKISAQKANSRAPTVPLPTPFLRSHRSTLPPGQPAPPPDPLPSHDGEQQETKPILRPRRSTRRVPPESKSSSPTAKKRSKQPQLPSPNPSYYASPPSPQQERPVTRGRQHNVDSGAAGPVTRASRKRKSSTSGIGTKENEPRRKSFRSSKSSGDSDKDNRVREESEGGGKGLLADRLKRAQDVKKARRSRRVAFADDEGGGKVNVAETPMEKGGVESRRLGTPRRVMRDKDEVEGWTSEQLRHYEMGRNSVAADEVGYWDMVAKGVEGKSADDCRRLWEGTWSSPQEGKKKEVRRVATPEMVSGLLKAGKTARGRGTGKFRTRARMLSDRVASGLGDDVLEPSILGNDDVVTPRNVAGVDVGTPGTVVREKRRGLEEAGKLETPEILSRGRNVGFEEADRYVGGFWNRAGKRRCDETDEGEGAGGQGGGEGLGIEEDVEDVGMERRDFRMEIGDGDVYSDEEEPFF